MEIYLVRHGQTEHNKNNLVQDGTSVLTPKGKEQAEFVANRLKHLQFEHLIVSDYERTKQTAQPIEGQSGVLAVYSPLFREISRPSEFVNTSRESDGFAEYLSQERESWKSDDTWKYSDEESFSEVEERMVKAMEYLKNLSGDTVVVTHGHFIRRLVANLTLGFELTSELWEKMHDKYLASNSGITVLRFYPETNHWQLLTFNDIASFAE